MSDASSVDSDTLLLIFTAANAVGAVLAAIAAFRSASAAKVSAEHAREVERRSVIREVILAASEIMADDARLFVLAKDFNRELKTSFALAGRSGGQGDDPDVAEAIKKLQPQIDEAKKFLDATSMLKTSSDDLTRSAAKLRVSATVVKTTRAELERRVNEMSAINAASRRR